MAEAYAEDGKVRKKFQKVAANSEVARPVGATRPRRKYRGVENQGVKLVARQPVVFME